MGILLRKSRPSTHSYDGYLKILYWLKLFGGFLKEGGGGGRGKERFSQLNWIM